jgi:hypothetical protein
MSCHQFTRGTWHSRFVHIQQNIKPRLTSPYLALQNLFISFPSQDYAILGATQTLSLSSNYVSETGTISIRKAVYPLLADPHHFLRTLIMSFHITHNNWNFGELRADIWTLATRCPSLRAIELRFGSKSIRDQAVRRISRQIEGGHMSCYAFSQNRCVINHESVREHSA